MVIMMALLAVSVAFAVNANPGSDVDLTTSAQTTTVNASLTLADKDFAGYRFGFCNSDPGDLTANQNDLDVGVSGLTKKDSVIIAYKGSGKADNTEDQIWWYYKLRTAKTVTVKITASQLDRSGDKLDYNINGQPVNGDDIIILNENVTSFAAKSGELKFTVDGLTPANIGEYTAAVKFSLVANA